MNLELSDLPSGIAEYPDSMNKTREVLIIAFQEEKKCPNIRKRIELISVGLRLLAEQMAYESGLKTKALGVIMQERLGKKTRKMLNG